MSCSEHPRCTPGPEVVSFDVVRSAAAKPGTGLARRKLDWCVKPSHRRINVLRWRCKAARDHWCPQNTQKGAIKLIPADASLKLLTFFCFGFPHSCEPVRKANAQTCHQNLKIEVLAWPFWARIRSRLAVQCRLRQTSAPQTDSTLIFHAPSEKSKFGLPTLDFYEAWSPRGALSVAAPRAAGGGPLGSNPRKHQMFEVQTRARKAFNATGVVWPHGGVGRHCKQQLCNIFRETFANYQQITALGFGTPQERLTMKSYHLR